MRPSNTVSVETIRTCMSGNLTGVLHRNNRFPVFIDIINVNTLGCYVIINPSTPGLGALYRPLNTSRAAGVARDSSVGIATGYGLDDPGME